MTDAHKKSPRNARPKMDLLDAGKKTEAEDPKLLRAADPKEVIRLGVIVLDETLSDKVRDKAAADILAQYGLKK